jgi:hypothetical protein
MLSGSGDGSTRHGPLDLASRRAECEYLADAQPPCPGPDREMLFTQVERRL